MNNKRAELFEAMEKARKNKEALSPEDIKKGGKYYRAWNSLKNNIKKLLSDSINECFFEGKERLYTAAEFIAMFETTDEMQVAIYKAAVRDNDVELVNIILNDGLHRFNKRLKERMADSSLKRLNKESLVAILQNYKTFTA